MSFFSNIWITGVSKPLTTIGADGGNPLCNIYIFSDTNPDFLELGSPFTGNLKVQIASDSETGIHPDIIAGRQGAFVASTDVINDPQWVQYEISAVAIEWLVDATYNGRIAYAKDDVWNYLDMGAPESITRTFIELDNTINSHYVLNTPFMASGNFSFEIYAKASVLGFHLFGNSDTDRVAITGSGTLVFKAANNQVQLSMSDTSFIDDEIHKFVISRVSNNLFVVVDDIDRGVVGGSASTLTITNIGMYTGSTGIPMLDGIAFDVTLSGASPTQSYSLNQAVGTSETSSEGSDTITYVNIPEANRELYEFDGNSTWTNISPPPQELPPIIEVPV